MSFNKTSKRSPFLELLFVLIGKKLTKEQQVPPFLKAQY